MINNFKYKIENKIRVLIHNKIRVLIHNKTRKINLILTMPDHNIKKINKIKMILIVIIIIVGLKITNEIYYISQ